MARIRTIKPEFWSSPNLPPDPWARLLFQAMWNWADDDGRGTANPRELMGFAFPNEEWMDLDYFRRLLGGVRRAFGVKFYKVAGRPYYEIPSWDNHQKIDKRSRSRHPSAEGGESFDPGPEDDSDQQEQSDSEEPAETPPTPRRILDVVPALEQGNRGTGESTPLSPPKGAKRPRRQTTPPPDSIPITDEMRAWAVQHAPDVRLVVETARLLDWARGKGERKADWIATWRNWMSRAQDNISAQSRQQLASGDEEWMR